jgi:ubiquinone/menaquinone biosynthesis C-methylase UbiE
VGVDISRPMVEQSRKRIRKSERGAFVLQGDAMRLPLKSSIFDAVLQFGGFNRFADPPKAIEEMARVAKPGGRIVIGDKSFTQFQEKTLREKLILKLEPQLDLKPPLNLIPEGMRDIELEWCWGGLVYVMKFTRP